MLPFPLATDDDGRLEMNGFARQALIWAAVAVLALPANENAQTAMDQSVDGISNGMSRADVIGLLGTPKGDFVNGGKESLLFAVLQEHVKIGQQNQCVIRQAVVVEQPDNITLLLLLQCPTL